MGLCKSKTRIQGMVTCCEEETCPRRTKNCYLFVFSFKPWPWMHLCTSFKYFAVNKIIFRCLQYLWVVLLKTVSFFGEDFVTLLIPLPGILSHCFSISSSQSEEIFNLKILTHQYFFFSSESSWCGFWDLSSHFKLQIVLTKRSDYFYSAVMHISTKQHCSGT